MTRGDRLFRQNLPPLTQETQFLIQILGITSKFFVHKRGLCSHPIKDFTRFSLSAIVVMLSGQHPSLASPVPQPQTPTLTPSPVKLLSTQPPKFSEFVSSPFPASELKHNQAIEVQWKLIIKLSDRRVYVYRDHQLQISYPIAVGREGWETPVGQYKVIQMIKNPIWEHPLTGEIIPPGPDNPLGERWIGFWTDGKNYIGFHGTPNTETVGQAASHGCIRMFNQDVLALFEKVKIGTPVIVEP